MQNLALSFWPDAPTIAKQLKDQKINFGKKEATKFQVRLKALNTRILSGELTHATAFPIANELAHDINNHVRTYVPEVVEPMVDAKSKPKGGVKKSAKKTAKKYTKTVSKKATGKTKKK